MLLFYVILRSSDLILYFRTYDPLVLLFVYLGTENLYLAHFRTVNAYIAHLKKKKKSSLLAFQLSTKF